MAGTSQGQGNKGNRILIIVFSVILVVLLVTVVVLARNIKRAKEEAAKNNEEPEKRQTLVNEDTVDQVVEELFEGETNTVPTSYDVVMTNNWTFPDGESESTDAYVENAKSNTTDMYFDLRLTDTQETIYESPVIPLGSHVDKIKLNRDLAPGTYDCELTYHLIDDEQNTLGTIDVVVTVIVKN